MVQGASPRQARTLGRAGAEGPGRARDGVGVPRAAIGSARA